MMDKISERLICFNITKSLREWDRGSVYECARKFWRISKLKAEQADYCLAISKGKVIAVYRPISWEVVECGEYKGRLLFNGTLVENSPYNNQDFSLEYEHVQNPVRYLGNWK